MGTEVRTQSPLLNLPWPPRPLFIPEAHTLGPWSQWPRLLFLLELHKVLPALRSSWAFSLKT